MSPGLAQALNPIAKAPNAASARNLPLNMIAPVQVIIFIADTSFQKAGFRTSLGAKPVILFCNL
jgi:hypothetical protein